MRTRFRSVATGAAVAAGVGALSYAAMIAAAWSRYGHTRAPESYPDALLDRFMALYDIEERHSIRIAAPADVVYRTAYRMDLNRSRITRAIFRTRGLVLGAEADHTVRPTGIVELTKSIGWGVLAEVPGREIVVGAATQPWVAHPVFRPLPPSEFAAFSEPDCVKIAWTLRAEPLGANASLFLTETRATTTDAAARAKFRRYWGVRGTGHHPDSSALAGAVEGRRGARVFRISAVRKSKPPRHTELTEHTVNAGKQPSRWPSVDHCVPGGAVKDRSAATPNGKPL